MEEAKDVWAIVESVSFHVTAVFLVECKEIATWEKKKIKKNQKAGSDRGVTQISNWKECSRIQFFSIPSGHGTAAAS